MPSSEPIVSVEELREAARLLAAEAGLRDAAADIGLSFSGLRTFLAGTSPYPRTLQKLRAWYALGGGTDTERTERALSILVGHLPPDRRSSVVREFAQQIERESQASEAEIPPWVLKVLNSQ